MVTIDDYTFDLAKMTSFKKGASKTKHLRRATWFYKENGIWTPYELPVCDILEAKWQKGEFKLPVLITTENPKKFVEFKNGTFTQYKPNKPQNNKEVQRGWNATILESVTETTSIITTVTRDGIAVGPGTPPYSKNLQPNDIQYVPVQTAPSGKYQNIQANAPPYPQQMQANTPPYPQQVQANAPPYPQQVQPNAPPLYPQQIQATAPPPYQTVPANNGYKQQVPYNTTNSPVVYYNPGNGVPQVQMMPPPGY